MRISLVTLGDPKTPTGGYLYHRRVAERAPENDAAVRFVSFPTAPFPLPALVARRVVRAAARADAIVIDSIAAAYARPALPAPIPVVGMLHQSPGGIDHVRLRSALQARMDIAAYRRCAGLMVASGTLRDEMLAAGFDPVVLVPPGRDVGVASEPADLGPGVHVLCVGNWIARKGIADLLDAFTRVRTADAFLHLVGDDRADRRYAARIRRRLGAPDLAGRVRVHGIVPTSRVAALYAAADVFALPSRAEPYGTVYGEAMAAGLPVVGWRAGNLPHLADDGVEGVILPVGDVDGLTRALARLIDDHSLRARLGAAARARAASLPTWDETAARFFTTVRALARDG